MNILFIILLLIIVYLVMFKEGFVDQAQPLKARDITVWKALFANKYDQPKKNADDTPSETDFIVQANPDLVNIQSNFVV